MDYDKNLNLVKKIPSIIPLSLIGLVFIILGIPIYGIITETQDILVSTDSTEAIIGINDEMIGKGAVCIPNVKRGEYIFFARFEDQEIQDTFFVSDNILIRKTYDNGGLPIKNSGNGITANVSLVNCVTWETFGILETFGNKNNS